jgi:ABC-type multidrug transport system ATPase subunit
MQNIIEINSISKRYGNIQALSEVDFTVPKGEIFGLIGPDGAGKTSLIRIIATLLLADSGSCKVLEYDTVKQYKQIRKEIGYMPGRFSLYQDLTVEENVELFAAIYNTTLKENYELIKPIYSQIEPFKKRRAGKLSGGMKQKLALSCALIHKPKLLILDEPTTGVDPVSRKEFWDMLANLKRLGITIFVSTPYMDEASLCDTVALIQNGKIMMINSPSNIVHSFGKKLYSMESENIQKLCLILKNIPEIASAAAFGDSVHVELMQGASINNIVELISKQGFHDLKHKPVEPKIEDVFITLMEKQ